MGHDYDDPEELKQILSVVSTEIPKLIESITKTMYNKENAENMAKAVAEFYKSMKDVGMNDSQAFALTKEFMASFSLGGMLGKAFQGAGSLRGDRDEIDDMVEESIREKIREKARERKEKSHEHDDDD
ncbi:MAG: hypothetical protein AB1793_01900 [Candidatus Thermoplasmatota archaeon]